MASVALTATLVTAGCGVTAAPRAAAPAQPAGGSAGAVTVLAARSSSYLAASVRPRADYVGGRPVVYLTFDDGPSPSGTPAVLSVLARHHAKATFFLIGKSAAAYPGLVRAEIAAGQAVGDHTWTHPHLTTLPRAEVVAQLRSTRDLLRSLGATARCFRPPFGATDATVADVARSLGLHEYLWTTESKDWTGAPAATDLARALAGLRPGAIIVFHDWVPTTPRVVDQLLTIAARRGYVAASLPC